MRIKFNANNLLDLISKSRFSTSPELDQMISNLLDLYLPPIPKFNFSYQGEFESDLLRKSIYIHQLSVLQWYPVNLTFTESIKLSEFTILKHFDLPEIQLTPYNIPNQWKDYIDYKEL